MAVYPSFVVYPGEKEIDSMSIIDKIGKGGEIKKYSSTLISDEGGRFFHDISNYEIYSASKEYLIKNPKFHWVNLSELKCLISFSNLVSIQLRAITTLILRLDEY
jgi:hypothetical protein